jgi:hypothetical protein
MKFIIHIEGLKKEHKLVEFDVPSEHLEETENYEEIITKAGWWYMNKIDFMSCTGPYIWSVFPKYLLQPADLKFHNINRKHYS